MKTKINNMKTIFLITLFFLTLSFGCATKVWVKKPATIKGKKVGIVSLNLFHRRTQEPLPNLAQNVSEGFNAYLHEAGFTVININTTEILKKEEAFRLCDSLKVDYIFVGSGAVGFNLGDAFLHDFAINIINVKTGEVELMATFNGQGVDPIRAVKKVGKKMIKRMEIK